MTRHEIEAKVLPAEIARRDRRVMRVPRNSNISEGDVLVPSYKGSPLLEDGMILKVREVTREKLKDLTCRHCLGTGRNSFQPIPPGHNSSDCPNCGRTGFSSKREYRAEGYPLLQGGALANHYGDAYGISHNDVVLRVVFDYEENE